MNRFICPHCGTNNSTDAHFCINCGTEFSELEDAQRGTQDDTHSSVSDQANLDPAAETTPPLETVPTDGSHINPHSESLDGDETDLSEKSESDATDASKPDRLITGLQGLLEPMTLSSPIPSQNPDALGHSDSTSSELPQPELPHPDLLGLLSATALSPRRWSRSSPMIELTEEQERQLRRLTTETPMILNTTSSEMLNQSLSLRIPWLFWLVGLLIGFPIFLDLFEPGGSQQQWPGVEEAYSAIQELPENSPVLIFWAYGPATAGEMDLVALPVLTHLLNRQSQLMIVSLLPTGPATARRLLNQVLAKQRERDILAVGTTPTTMHLLNESGYLPGGPAVLPLLGQDLRMGLQPSQNRQSPELQELFDRSPLLEIVIAAQAEDVQRWLEHVQPFHRTSSNGIILANRSSSEGQQGWNKAFLNSHVIPTIALTSAGADPILRPYWNSGQLQGLVSGFDGGFTYRTLHEGPRLTTVESNQWRQHFAVQNWGAIALIVSIVLTNITAFIGRSTRG